MANKIAMSEHDANKLAMKALQSAKFIVDTAMDLIIAERGAVSVGNCDQGRLLQLQIALIFDIKPRPPVGITKATYLS